MYAEDQVAPSNAQCTPECLTFDHSCVSPPSTAAFPSLLLFNLALFYSISTCFSSFSILSQLYGMFLVCLVLHMCVLVCVQVLARSGWRLAKRVSNRCPLVCSFSCALISLWRVFVSAGMYKSEHTPLVHTHAPYILGDLTRITHALWSALTRTTSSCTHHTLHTSSP